MKESEIQEKLQRDLEASRERMRNCKHDFADPIYVPEKEMVADDRAGYEVHGVDRWPRMSFHEEWIPRWSRKCKKCGHKEYTKEQEPVSMKTKPKFN